MFKTMQYTRKLWPFIENFCKKSTIHGLNIIALPNLHPLERIMWLAIVIAAALGASVLTIENWSRFNSNPTVVSLQKDYRNWENLFPATSGCFKNKTDMEKAQKYIERRWGLTPSNKTYQYYLDFVRTVASTTYFGLQEYERFKNDRTLDGVDMVALVTEVHPALSGTLVTVERSSVDWELILGELGVCFIFNSKFTDLFAIKDSEAKNSTKKFSNPLVKCHYLNGLCYARYDSDPTLPVKYYIHSYMDVAHIGQKHYIEVGRSEEMEINYKMIETVASPSIKYLSPMQRKCRFEDEPINDDIPIYSTTVCYMMCRYHLALELCGCKPFFYHFFAGKTCDINGLLCLAEFSEKITQAPSKYGCNCPEPCNLITYLPQIPKFTKWEESGYFEQRISFRWGLLHPTTKYKRDIIFGFGDLIVSLGGTVNLFLGISFLSLFEATFLVCESIIKGVKRYRNVNKQVFVMQKTKFVSKIGSDGGTRIVEELYSTME